MARRSCAESAALIDTYLHLYNHAGRLLDPFS